MVEGYRWEGLRVMEGRWGTGGPIGASSYGWRIR